MIGDVSRGRQNTENHDMAMLGWSADIGDPDNFFYYLLSKEAAQSRRAISPSIAVMKCRKSSSKRNQPPIKRNASNFTKKPSESFTETSLGCHSHTPNRLLSSTKSQNLKLHPTTWKYFGKFGLSNEVQNPSNYVI